MNGVPWQVQRKRLACWLTIVRKPALIWAHSAHSYASSRPDTRKSGMRARYGNAFLCGRGRGHAAAPPLPAESRADFRQSSKGRQRVVLIVGQVPDDNFIDPGVGEWHQLLDDLVSMPDRQNGWVEAPIA